MTDLVTIGCSLPHGLTLTIGEPGTEGYQFTELAGRLKARKGAKYGTTKVDTTLWVYWVGENNTLRYVAEGSVFVLDGTKKLHPLTLKVFK